MNYLAHALLSFGDKDILAGNLVSDFIKGKAQYAFPLRIQRGIRLHRMIDEFTDRHPATSLAKSFFKPHYRLYSGAFVDVVYDHFLSLDKNYFDTDEALMQFARQTTLLLNENYVWFPVRFQKMLPFMEKQNWLYNYQFPSGIQNSFRSIAHRAAYLSESDIAFNIFNINYDELKKCYHLFFSELYNFSKQNMRNLFAD